MFLLTLLVRLLRAACKSRDELVLENLALRQQVAALKLGRHTPRLHNADRAFWVALRKTWSHWTSRLMIVKPETVVDWQRRRFSEHNPDPDVLKRWMAFLRNHKDAIAGMDFFTVPTATLNVLYGFFVIHHDRRRILHLNATYHPTAHWVMQQLRKAFPFDSAPRHLIFDRDSIFCPAVVEFVKGLGAEPSRTAYRSPWQNPVAERWIGSLRRELLDHVVVLSQQHLVRLLKLYIRYYHEDRCHLGLDRDTPDRRPVTPRPSSNAKVMALPRVGGLHHRYVWREAA